MSRVRSGDEAANDRFWPIATNPTVLKEIRF
jgi:hypothetical protein